MSINLLDRFKKLPEQLKNMSNKELNETIDSAKHIADEHAKVANRYEDQADKIEAERRRLEEQLRNMGIKQLSPAGYRLQRKIKELKKREEDKRLLAEGYRDQEFYERTRASEAKVLQNKKYSHQEKPEYSKQMQQEYYDYLKYDTTAGRMITAREKMENETDPVKRKKLKEIYEAREKEHQEYVDSIVYKQDPKPLKAEVKPEKEPVIGLEKVTEPQPATGKTIDTEPPESEVEERKQVLLDLKNKINESKPGRPKQLSLTPHMPPPNIQAEKTTPEKAIEPKSVNEIEKEIRNKKEESRQNLEATTKPNQERDDSVSKPFEDTRDSKILKDKNPTPENIQKYEENRRTWKQYIDDKFKNKDNRDPERDPERDPDRGPDRSPKR